MTKFWIATTFILASVVSWFLGNFFYDLLWTSIEDHHVKHSDVIGYTLAHLSSFAICVIGAVIIYGVVRYNIRKLFTSEKQSNIRQDMPISDAIDYLVNDSRAILKQPPPPEIVEFGPAKGQRVTYSGVEHTDARAQLNEKLISGELRIWGRRQIDTHISSQFEHSFREIPSTYWNTMQLHMLSCFGPAEHIPQTMAIPGKAHEADYTNLMVNRRQVRALWPRKFLWTRLHDRIIGKARIKYWRLGDRSDNPDIRARGQAISN